LIFNVLKKIVSQPSLLNSIIGVLSQGLKNGGFTQEFAQVLQGKNSKKFFDFADLGTVG